MKDNSLRIEKLKKRESLLKHKVDPYPHDWRKESWKAEDLSDSSRTLAENKAKTSQSFSQELDPKTAPQTENRAKVSLSDSLTVNQKADKFSPGEAFYRKFLYRRSFNETAGYG